MIWIYLIACGIAFGVLSSLAVKKKNRNQGAWFFIGFLFGVFGLIAAVLVDKLEIPEQSSQSVTCFDPSILTKKCPECAETIKLEARVCRFCQHRFSDEEAANQMSLAKQQFDERKRAEQKTTGSQWQCPNCYTINKPESTTCARCRYNRQADAALRLREIVCPSCNQTELIPQNQLFALRSYTRFEAQITSRFGFQKLHLRCLKCSATFTLDPSY